VDYRDVFLEATAEVQEIVREIFQELALPQMKAQIKQAWMSAPDEMKDAFQSERPQEYQDLMDLIQ
jgi:hypothetical protein